jgi:hypothetical protein
VFWPIAIGVVALLALTGAAFVYRRRRHRPSGTASTFNLPERVTPLSTVMALRRISSTHAARLDADGRGRLDRDIAAIELKYFGPGADTEPDGDLHEALSRWASLAGSDGG